MKSQTVIVSIRTQVDSKGKVYVSKTYPTVQEVVQVFVDGKVTSVKTTTGDVWQVEPSRNSKHTWYAIK